MAKKEAFSIADFAKTIIENANNDTNLILKDFRVQLQKECKEWLDTTNKLNKRFTLYLDQLKRSKAYREGVSDDDKKLRESSSARFTAVYTRYINLNRHIKNLKNQQEIIEHMKKGYRLIHNVREILTGQEIEYLIAYKDKKDGPVCQVKLTMEQLLKNVSKAVESNISESAMADALKISLSNTNLIKTLQELNDNEEEKAKEGLDSKLYNYISSRAINSNKSQGDIYEIYLIMTKEKKYKPENNLQNGNSDALIDALIQAKHNSDPGWQGGDVGSFQAKAVYNANASLMSLGTMRRQITKIAELFETEQINYNKIKKMFIKEINENALEIDKSAADLAESGLKKTFENWGVKVSN